MRNFLFSIQLLKNKFIQRKLHHRWVIKPHLPWYKKGSVILGLTIVIATVLGSYIYLQHFLINKNSQLILVTNKYHDLKQKYNLLKSTKVKMQRELEIFKQSQLEINNNLLELHQKSQNLTEQVDLYKRVMSDNIASESILIENIQLLPLTQTNTSANFMLRWVLLQASNKRNLLQGKLDIKISGKLGSSPKVLNYSQIALDKTSNLGYKFKNFQQFNKKIKLPDNFVVENITVEMLDSSTKLSKSKTYEWNNNNNGRNLYVAEAQV